MRDISGPFSRLGLTPEADAKAIRKAYARELKKIDQEQDPAGFQSLREAYEQALEWQANPMADRAPEQLNARQVALAAWQHCQQRVSASDIADSQAWERSLHSALSEESLVQLEARMHFEVIVAEHLVYRSHPAQEFIFLAAVKLFHWDEDQRRLNHFRHAGTVINHAITQYRQLKNLPEREQASLRATLSRMQEPRSADLEDLGRHSHAIIHLNRIFPALMEVVLGRATFHYWVDACFDESFYALSAEEEAEWEASEKSKEGNQYRFILGLLAFMLFAGLLAWGCVTLGQLAIGK